MAESEAAVVHSMTSIVEDADALGVAPDPSDLTREHAIRPVAWSTRARSGSQGLLAGAVVTTGLHAIAAIGDPGWSLAVGLTLTLGTVLVLLLVRGGEQDLRWYCGAAAVVPAGVLAVGAGEGGVVVDALLVLLVGLAVGLTVQVDRTIRRWRRRVLEWNRAYARLAAAPLRARSAHLETRLVDAGPVRRVEGHVVYVGQDGTEHEVPLTTMAQTRLEVPPDTPVGPGSTAVAWHSADHSVVLTRVLATRV